MTLFCFLKFSVPRTNSQLFKFFSKTKMATEEKATDGLENSSKDSASSESITKEALDKNEKVIGPVLPTPIPSDDRQLKDQDIFVGDYHCLAQY